MKSSSEPRPLSINQKTCRRRNALTKTIVEELTKEQYAIRSIMTSLNGFAFTCGGQANFRPVGPVALFDGTDKIFCLNELTLQTYNCGTYTYDGDKQLTLDVQNVGSATATNLQYIDNVLISFQIDGLANPCIVQAHDWRVLVDQPNDYVKISCPIQNPVPADSGAISYEENVFSFYPTGNVWGTSWLELVEGKDTIRRDGHGVFFWDSASQRIHMYFGPQQQREAFRLQGTLLPNGALTVDDYYTPSGNPCTYKEGSGSDISKYLPSTQLPSVAAGSLSSPAGVPSSVPPTFQPAGSPSSPLSDQPTSSPFNDPVSLFSGNSSAAGGNEGWASFGLVLIVILQGFFFGFG